MKGKNLYLTLLSLFFISVVSLDPLSHKEDFHDVELDFECTFCLNETEVTDQLQKNYSLITFTFQERTLKEYIHIRPANSSFSEIVFFSPLLAISKTSPTLKISFDSLNLNFKPLLHKPRRENSRPTSLLKY